MIDVFRDSCLLRPTSPGSPERNRLYVGCTRVRQRYIRSAAEPFPFTVVSNRAYSTARPDLIVMAVHQPASAGDLLALGNERGEVWGRPAAPAARFPPKSERLLGRGYMLFRAAPMRSARGRFRSLRTTNAHCCSELKPNS
jgi:hypothetical protein